MKATILAVGLVLIAGHASAEPIPRYDIDAHCRAFLNPPRGTPETPTTASDRYTACFAINQKAYDELKPVWETLKTFEQTECTKLRAFESYETLLYCAKGALTPEYRVKLDRAQEMLNAGSTLRQIDKALSMCRKSLARHIALGNLKAVEG